MIKHLLIAALTGYKLFLSPLLRQLLGSAKMCRYSVSCSDYAKDVITKHGTIKGGRLAVKRVLSCSPLTKHYAYI